MVVDDSLLPRHAATSLLGASERLRLAGVAASGEQALEIFESIRPDLVLVDVDMPGMDGAATAKALKVRQPDLPIVGWSVSDSSDDLLRMMQAGCIGYVLKDVGPSELERALVAAMGGESPLPRRMIAGALRRAAERSPWQDLGAIKLTPREHQVLKGIAKGFTTKRLASEMGLAIPSVETHLQHLFRKLKAGNRGEAVSTALKAGLISFDDL